MSYIAAAIAASAAVTYYQGEKARKTMQDANNAAIAQAQREAEAARAAEEKRQTDVAQGRQNIDDAFAQFDDDFYSGRSQAYMDYAMPQLDDEYQDSMKKLVTALSRGGNLNSSLRGERMADLNEQYNKRKIDLQNTADDYANQAKTQIESNRQDLYNTNQNLADPTLTKSNATSSVASLMQQPSFSPLGDLLSDFTSGLATQADLERRQMANYDLLFNRDPYGSGSGRIV